MPIVPRRRPRSATTIDSKRAASLLYPIAAFLRAGGLSKRQSLNSLGAAFENSLNAKSPRQMEHIGHPTGYADIITLWSRDKEFLGRSGRPRALSLKGRFAFAKLVQKANCGIDPRTALSVLVGYGNVRRNRLGQYELVRPFFFASSHTKMAFEPLAFFLSDASSTLSKILRRRKNSRTPELFWRKVESTLISDADAGKFNTFATERSLLFLEELDDWLEAHAREGKRAKGKTRRVGLGLFSIYSDPETGVPRR
jgi:hypothetical protein